MESLTKENFWNELLEKYPEQMKVFCAWIDGYKKRVNWNKLFNSDSDYQNYEGKNAPAPKYHDLPIAMQIGIFMQFLAEQNPDCMKDWLQFPNAIKECLETNFNQ